jgi:hypothetical protein
LNVDRDLVLAAIARAQELTENAARDAAQDLEPAGHFPGPTKRMLWALTSRLAAIRSRLDEVMWTVRSMAEYVICRNGCRRIKGPQKGRLMISSLSLGAGLCWILTPLFAPVNQFPEDIIMELTC